MLFLCLFLSIVTTVRVAVSLRQIYSLNYIEIYRKMVSSNQTT
nr:MAG TPA: hypothetical protein [Bacteriophage sp.]DAR79387.1 MAG TPA: hypothetical protein [Caudoviricetes sp.]